MNAKKTDKVDNYNDNVNEIIDDINSVIKKTNELYKSKATVHCYDLIVVLEEALKTAKKCMAH